MGGLFIGISTLPHLRRHPHDRVDEVHGAPKRWISAAPKGRRNEGHGRALWMMPTSHNGRDMRGATAISAFPANADQRRVAVAATDNFLQVGNAAVQTGLAE